MLAIGKVTPLSPEGQPPWPPFSWLTRPHKEIPVLCILVLGLGVKDKSNKDYCLFSGDKPLLEYMNKKLNTR